MSFPLALWASSETTPSSAPSALRWLAVGITFGLALVAPRVAEACWTCGTNADCPNGYLCASRAGEPNACEPSSCASDDECAAGMRCVLEVTLECVGDSCSTSSACVPVWQTGCNVAADCGPGFECVNLLADCTGDECLKECRAVEERACQIDADCPSCWSCTAQSNTDLTCFDPSDRGATGKVCRPPHWGLMLMPYLKGPAVGASPPAAACSVPVPTGTTDRTDPPETSEAVEAGCTIGVAPGAGAWAWLGGVAGVSLLGLGRARRRRA